MCANYHSADSSGRKGTKLSDKSKLISEEQEKFPKENTEMDTAKQTKAENDGAEKDAQEKVEDGKQGRVGGEGGDGNGGEDNGEGICDGTGKRNDGDENDEDGKNKNLLGDDKSTTDDGNKTKKQSRAAVLVSDSAIGKTLIK